MKEDNKVIEVWDTWEEEAIISIREQGNYFCTHVEDFVESSEEIIIRLSEAEKRAHTFQTGLFWIIAHHYGEEVQFEVPVEIVKKYTSKKSNLGVFTTVNDDGSMKVVLSITFDEE